MRKRCIAFFTIWPHLQSHRNRVLLANCRVRRDGRISRIAKNLLEIGAQLHINLRDRYRYAEVDQRRDAEFLNAARNNAAIMLQVRFDV